ncbi:hypothetical protein [Streptomyces sp. NPDC018833]|uniref:hypothetical protein n=1 Tax=Streptomyces sp. NPDC018833 TaxID=3365053 RepID=UPI0037A7B0CF
MSPTDMTRRHALTAVAGVTAAASLASTGLLATPAIAAPQPLRNDELKEALRRVDPGAAACSPAGRPPTGGRCRRPPTTAVTS